MQRAGAPAVGYFLPQFRHLPDLHTMMHLSHCCCGSLPFSHRRASFAWSILNFVWQVEQKRFVVSDKSDVAHVFRARVSRDRVTRSRLKTLMAQLYDGAAGPLVLQLVQTERLTPKEIEKLQELVGELDVDG